MAKGLFDWKGKTMIQLAPEAKFTNVWQVIIFWAFNLWLIQHVGALFGFDVLYRMFSWLPIIGRFF